MSYIELAIKIDEDTYNNFVRNEYSRVDVIAMHTALINGTPQPKSGKPIECNIELLAESEDHG